MLAKFNFFHAYAFNFINRCFGSLFWLWVFLLGPYCTKSPLVLGTLQMICNTGKSQLNKIWCSLWPSVLAIDSSTHKGIPRTKKGNKWWTKHDPNHQIGNIFFIICILHELQEHLYDCMNLKHYDERMLRDNEYGRMMLESNPVSSQETRVPIFQGMICVS